MTTSTIRTTLERIGAITPERVEQFAPRTRDREVPVWVDPVSGVLFIDNYYVGDAEYSSGSYRADPVGPDFEDWSDTKRRIDDFRSLYFGQSVLDFGCGAGSFLRLIQPTVASVQGVELQESYRDALLRDGIACFDSLDHCSPMDVAFLFHVLEHLPDPLPVLKQLKALLVDANGLLVVEVPHARDFLISSARNQPFIDFTLWSQHLVLHTRDSLRSLLIHAGFTEISIWGVQRYGIANHMKWLIDGKPGGHKGSTALIETQALSAAYAAALAQMDATDTLVATAR